MDRRRSPPEWRVRALIAGAIVAIAAARTAVGEPALGLSFLSALPIAAAAIILGRASALVAAAGALALVVLNETVVDPRADLDGTLRAAALASRAVVFFAMALVVGELATRERRSALALAVSEREVVELAAVRDALVPPALPSRPGLELGAAFVPAGGLVGGDFFLVAPTRDDATALIVGDVLGHGVEAAQRGAFVRAALATYLAYEADPAQLLRLVDRALLDRHDASPQFVTAVCAVIRNDGVLHWASAGHWPPWDLDRGEPLVSPARCLPLGIGEQPTCETARVRLDPGAGVLLYTDGLIEAAAGDRRGGPRERLGETAAQTELRRHAGQPPSAVVRALQQTTLSFAGGALADDLCLLAARRARAEVVSERS